MYDEFEKHCYDVGVSRKITWCTDCGEDLGAYVKCSNCNGTGRINENTLCDCTNGAYWESEVCQECDI